MFPLPKQGQRSFADLELACRPAAADNLAAAAHAVDWPSLASRLTSLYPSPVGRPAHPPLMLFKSLLLRRWFNLSDPGLEAGLRDRLSWQRFCGFSLADLIPDETTFCRFRRRLGQAGLGETLFHEVEKQIRGAGQRLPAPK